jgi:predicted DsbA family dithiol-disulfide isomerase
MQVEIWSDVVCPWCYIGKRRFEAALASFEHPDEVEVVWRSFELDPTTPRRRSGDLAQHLSGKYGIDIGQARQLQERVTAVAAAEGLEYRFDLAQPTNSFDAHRSIHFARRCGEQDAMKERLLRAYFTEGRNVADLETLVELASDVGLAGDEVRSMLSSDELADDVRADQREARALGISGVPFFVLDRAYGVSGAQPAEVMLDALRTAWAAAQPVAASAQSD